MNYRSIYQKHYGPIPKDADGRTYEIHHIDGNHSNNDPSNLKAVTIQEHYDIHYSQGDWGACFLIARKMKLSPVTLSEISKQTNIKRIADGTHNLVGPTNNKNRINNGTHPFLDKKSATQRNFNRINKGTHNLLGPNHALERLAKGTHPSQIKKICPHCGESRPITSYNRLHGDKCHKKAQALHLG